MTDLNEVMGSSFVRVKLVTFVHFFFISNAMIGMLSTGSYEFYNFLFIASLLWTMHSKESIDAALVALSINICSIFLDIAYIIVYVHLMNGWALAFCIINLCLRPVTSVLLQREYSSRGGLLPTGAVFPTSQQRSYQDIDVPTQPTPTNSHPGPNVPSIF